MFQKMKNTAKTARDKMLIHYKKPMHVMKGRPLVLIIVLFAIGFFMFVWRYESYTKASQQINSLHHNKFFELYLWNIDTISAQDYIDLITKAYDYKKVDIKHFDGDPFVSFQRSDAGTLAERFFSAIGLIKTNVINNKIVYKGKHIGDVEIVWINKNMYVYIYILLILILVIKITQYYFNIISQRKQLRLTNLQLEEQSQEIEDKNIKLSQAMKALWGEMELAKRIQTALLPLQPDLTNYEISLHMTPADEVGGDYYDVITVKDINWIVIGDVSGHGIPAGLIMMMVQTAIHTALLENGETSPSQLLSIVNRSITENIVKLKEQKYMTITVLAGQKDNTFYFSGLHQDILIYRAKKGIIEAIETNGMWLGVMNDIEGLLQTDHFELDVDDTILLYTDGVTEALDEKNEMFGQERLETIFRTAAIKSTEEIKQLLLEELTPYKKSDDITFVILKRKN